MYFVGKQMPLIRGKIEKMSGKCKNILCNISFIDAFLTVYIV